jgi:hypothetical protein
MTFSPTSTACAGVQNPSMSAVRGKVSVSPWFMPMPPPTVTFQPTTSPFSTTAM